MRADKLRVERAAVAATELPLTRCAELFMAVPVVDHGVDLMAYQAGPFRVAKIQVKGATHDLKVFRQYSLAPMIVSYVLDPLGAAGVVLLTGEQAWSLPIDYVARGGAAGGHHPGNDDYHWRNARHCCRRCSASTWPPPSGGLSCSTRPPPHC
jgi:hypothetical protein